MDAAPTRFSLPQIRIPDGRLLSPRARAARDCYRCAAAGAYNTCDQTPVRGFLPQIREWPDSAYISDTKADAKGVGWKH